MRRAALALVLALAGCSGGEDTPNSVAPDLESVAIERGLVRDPTSGDIAGLYAHGGDRLCVVPAADRLRVGVYVLDATRPGCSASGTAERSGDRLRIDFGGGCVAEAQLEGVRIVFPARLPTACTQRCTARTSLGGLRVERLSDVVSEAAALRDPGGRAICGS